MPVLVAPEFSLHEHLGPLNSLGFVKEARRNTKHLPGVVFDALMDFKIDPPAAGAIVISNLTLGVVPPTPSLPGTNHSSGALTSEMVAVTISELLGHAVGYAPEHNGDIVQVSVYAYLVLAFVIIPLYYLSLRIHLIFPCAYM